MCSQRHCRCRAPLLSTQSVECFQESRRSIDCDIAVQTSSTFWNGRCSCFVGFGSHVVSVLLLFSPYSETLSRELRDVDV